MILLLSFLLTENWKVLIHPDYQYLLNPDLALSGKILPPEFSLLILRLAYLNFSLDCSFYLPVEFFDLSTAGHNEFF